MSLKRKNKALKRKYSNGFSMLELLVVIAIIGIFTAIGVASFTNTASETKFKKANILLETFIEEVQAKAFADNKPYKMYLENSGDNINMTVYGPAGTSWYDPNLMRRCDCHVGVNSGDSNCSNVFLTTTAGQTPIKTKTIEDINIKKCNNENCDTETIATVSICLLSNGTSARTTYFKIQDNFDEHSK